MINPNFIHTALVFPLVGFLEMRIFAAFRDIFRSKVQNILHGLFFASAFLVRYSLFYLEGSIRTAVI